jgi:hypothetical protein
MKMKFPYVKELFFTVEGMFIGFMLAAMMMQSSQLLGTGGTGFVAEAILYLAFANYKKEEGKK